MSDTGRIDKWALFHDLCTARIYFGVTDRDLSVLNALLTFLPAKELVDGAQLIVFPSNASLAARAHGMAESTLRRHLAALTNAGLIARRDSPNGKRYSSRSDPSRTFGFDLRPLLVRAVEITDAAARTTQAARTLRLAREAVVLQLRDAQKLISFGMVTGLPGQWLELADQLFPLRQALRRQLTLQILDDMSRKLVVILTEVHSSLQDETAEMATSDSQNERHHSNSNINIQESESCHEKNNTILPPIPLHLVLRACPDIAPYSRHPIRHWHELVACANGLRGMLGISAETWQDAKQVMGAEAASVVLSAMVQRINMIRKPGGYLRKLTQQMADRTFTPGPMIMALLTDYRPDHG